MRARWWSVAAALGIALVASGCGGDNLEFCDGCGTPVPTVTLTPTPTVSTSATGATPTTNVTPTTGGSASPAPTNAATS